MRDRWTGVLRDLEERFAADADVTEVTQYLSAKGFDRRQIGEILSLLHRHTVDAVASAPDPGHGSDVAAQVPAAIPAAVVPALRVQGPHERGRFTPEAWGYLLTLNWSGMVTSYDFEQLVERALSHVDGRIGLPEIRAFADAGGLDDTHGGTDRSRVH